MILNNYIKMIQLYKNQRDLCITRIHTANKKTQKENSMTKKSCRSKLQHATSPSALHNHSSTWTMKYTPEDNASNEKTTRACTIIAVTQPTKPSSKVFTRGSHSSESKQCLQQGHCQVQPVKVRPRNFFPEAINRYKYHKNEVTRCCFHLLTKPMLSYRPDLARIDRS